MSQVAPALIRHGSTTVLPVELVQILNQAYFLHLLATDPAKVVPPGKSLLSMMTSAHIGGQQSSKDQTAALHDKVAQVVDTAFWNGVCSSLLVTGRRLTWLHTGFGRSVIPTALGPAFASQELVPRYIRCPVSPAAACASSHPVALIPTPPDVVSPAFNPRLPKGNCDRLAAALRTRARRCN